MQYDPDTLRRLQMTQLGILKDIDRVCREQGIAYFLDSGTLLGAVRHKGFIPWDDDVDIGMLRADYERFLAAAPKALGDAYEVSEPMTNDRNAGMFAKVWLRGTKFATHETMEAGIPQGIFVDVFPYDALSADAAQAKRQIRTCRRWQSLSYLYHARTIVVPHKGALGAAERAACRIAHVLVHAALSHDRICAAYHAAIERGSAVPGGRYLSFAYPVRGGYPIDVLVPPSRVTFEGCDFPGPADPERYLESMYGADWGELPPVEERTNHAPVELDFGC